MYIFCNISWSDCVWISTLFYSQRRIAQVPWETRRRGARLPFSNLSNGLEENALWDQGWSLHFACNACNFETCATVNNIHIRLFVCLLTNKKNPEINYQKLHAFVINACVTHVVRRVVWRGYSQETSITFLLTSSHYTWYTMGTSIYKNT